MNLPRQIEAARVARGRRDAEIDRQTEALRAERRVLMTEDAADLEIARILRARKIVPTLTEAQRADIMRGWHVPSLVRRAICNPISDTATALTALGYTLRDILNGTPPLLPVLRRIAQHAIDAHCAMRAAARIPSEVSVYDRDDLEKYLAPDRYRPASELRILASRLLPSEALTLLLSLLPPENA